MPRQAYVEPLDLVIVGAGPCGIAAGAAARTAGLRAVLLDRGCVTRSLVDYPYYMTFFSTAEKLEVGGIPFVVADGKPTRRDALVYYRRVVRHFGLDVRQYEEVAAVAGREGDFSVRTIRRDGTEGHLGARAVVVATGGFQEPNRLGVEGEGLPKVLHRYREPYPFFDQDVLVVGGGNSAVEAALELYRSGARVILVHFAHELDRGVKPWVRPDIMNRIDKGEVGVRWGARVAEIGPRSVLLRKEDGGEVEELPNDWVLAMTGWRADPRLLRDLGVSVDPVTGIPAHDPRTMETDVPGVFIAGVLAAGHDANKIFIENGREHGELVVRALLERSEARARAAEG